MMKKILVTGGNKGIGLAIVKKLLKDYPDTLVLLGSRDVSRGHAAVEDVIGDLSSINIIQQPAALINVNLLF